MCVDSSRQYSVYECVYACDYMPSPWTMNTNTHYLAEVEVSHMQVKLKSLFPPLQASCYSLAQVKRDTWDCDDLPQLSHFSYLKDSGL